jgi:flagellin-like hook-associated protein FlgL
MNMTGIVLSASVRQNLLSLQSTASLLATTQNDLATGNKVNSALDDPTSFFTAAALNNRASDISNLLDGIGNGVQVLQAANTGITSLQSLVASAQSVANQVLQTPIGYDTKSSITSSAIAGATANNLLGTGAAATSGTVTAGAFSTLNVSGTGTTASSAVAATPVTGTGFATLDLSGANTASFTLNVDGTSHSITLDTAAVSAFTAAGGTISATNAALSAADVAKIVDFEFNSSDTTGAGPVQTSGSDLQISSGTTGTPPQVVISGYTASLGSGSTGLTNATSTGTAGVSATSADSESFTVQVNTGSVHTITLSNATVSAYNTANGASLSASGLTAANVASIVNYQFDPSGATTVASVVGGALTFASGTTGTSSTVAVGNISGTASAGSTGIVSGTGTGVAATNALSGETLKLGATGNGTATTITFGTGTGQVSTLNDLNTALSADNLQATISTTGVLTITTSNNAASSLLGGTAGISGTATTGSAIFAGATPQAAVADPDAQATRAGLVSQYNNILAQIDTTAQDSSFNGINLLEGDTLNLTFDETGKSTLAIKGVTFNTAGLGLSTLASGTDFLDSNSANAVLASLNNVSTTLRSEASNLGSNLSIVQIRQDFSKNLINVLQTGASNLTLADTNEEAANSQALSTRQSIAVSALALANQSQQSVLQLLR